MDKITKNNGTGISGSCESCDSAKNLYCYFPNSITLTTNVVALSGINELRFPDACGLFDDLGIGNPVTTQDFDIRGSISADSVRSFTQTHAGRIKMINYSCPQDESQLKTKLK